MPWNFIQNWQNSHNPSALPDRRPRQQFHPEIGTRELANLKKSGPKSRKAAQRNRNDSRSGNDQGQRGADTLRPVKRSQGTGSSISAASETGVPAPLRHKRNRLRETTGQRAPEAVAMLLETAADENYALLDSGDGLKLERYGSLIIVRPEGQAMWRKTLPESRWQEADAVFTGDTDEEGLGRWLFPKRNLEETFPMVWDGLDYLGRFTSFRHTGVFPEQAAHWRFAADQIKKMKASSEGNRRILNLFGYTGIASLVAARAGAEVTHVDASKKAIGWARENQRIAGLENLPIRWICEDAVKYCERELRRGSRYEGILLDPPAYGRGPKGEVWQFFDDIPYLLDICRELLSPDARFSVLTAYTIRASSLAIHELMQEVHGDLPGRIESGELALRTAKGDRRLSTSMFSRWVREP